jgi:nucleotide-binding universal stress UspA family protein
VAGQSGKDLGDAEGEHRLQAEKELRSAVAQLGDDVEAEIGPVVGDPAEVLVDLSPHIDLLVCGSRGYGPVRTSCSAACRAASRGRCTAR